MTYFSSSVGIWPELSTAMNLVVFVRACSSKRASQQKSGIYSFLVTSKVVWDDSSMHGKARLAHPMELGLVFCCRGSDNAA